MNGQVTPAEHEASFRRVSENLRRVADALVAEHRDFPAADFGRCFLGVGIALLLDAAGTAETAAYLRTLADGLEPAARKNPPPCGQPN